MRRPFRQRLVHSQSGSGGALRWWGLLTASAAPALLVGGYTLAAARYPGDFDSVTGTISALAARDAPGRWVMTTALLGLGLCHLGTAAALRPARLPGRVLLGLGGLATLGVALAPLPAGGGSSTVHGLTAGAAFLALSVWPALAVRPAPGALRTPVATAATAALLALTGWFTAELLADTTRVGLAERVAATGQALWPLVVVLSAAAASGRRRR